jgi:hypothetical protein
MIGVTASSSRGISDGAAPSGARAAGAVADAATMGTGSSMPLASTVPRSVRATPSTRSCQVHDAGACQHLSRGCARAEPRGQVERSAPESSLELDRLAGIQSDANGQRRGRVDRNLVREGLLEVDGRAQRLARGVEHGERFVAAQLDHLAASRFDALADDLGERGGQPGGGLIPVGLRERGVPPHVRDQECPHPRGLHAGHLAIMTVRAGPLQAPLQLRS